MTIIGGRTFRKIINGHWTLYSLSELKGYAWDEFSLYIRIRDCIRTTGCPSWGLCVTCGKRYHIKLLQAGHFVAGRHNANLFYEKGCHAQGYNCNINLKGNTLVYRRKIIEMYGKGADVKIELNDKKECIYSKEDMMNLLKKFRKLRLDLTKGETNE